MTYKTNACQPQHQPPPSQQQHHHETVIVKAGPSGIVPAAQSPATIILPPTVIEPVSRTYQYRKVMKPMLERKRRARINRCLDELKELMVTALQSEGENVSKLEKADILELTVRHLHKLKRQQRLAGNPIIDSDRFRAGFTHAANEVSHCLAATPGVNIDLGTKLMTHLGHRLNDLDKVQPLTIQIGQQSQQQYQHQNSNAIIFNDNNNNNNMYNQSSTSSSTTQIFGNQSSNQQRLLSPPSSTSSSPLCCDVKYMMPLTPSSSGCSSNYSGTPSPELTISCSQQQQQQQLQNQMDFTTNFENQTQDLLLKVVGHTSSHHHHHLKEPVWRPW